MPNTLGVYDPIFYAQEALIQLEKALGMAGRVHRGFEAERAAFGKGQVVNIRRPSTFVAADAPASASDLDTETIAITLDQWKEVKFALTDQELAYTGERIIEDHIRPAAVALADNIDQALAALYKDIPHFDDLTGTPLVADIIQSRTTLFNLNAPVQDVGRLHFMIDGDFEGGLLGLEAFSQQQGAGDIGVNTQMRGSLGLKYGFEIFANQNTPSHTPGTLDDTSLVLNGAVAKGATVMSADDAAVTGTILKGDTFVIAGDTQRYAVTGDVTASGNEIAAVGFTPPAAIAYSDGDAVTIELDTHVANLAFHRNAFALAMAPLSEMGGELGAKIAMVQDPITGLSLRSRVFYIGDTSEVRVALDVLYGVKTLDPNLATRGRG